MAAIYPDSGTTTDGECYGWATNETGRSSTWASGYDSTSTGGAYVRLQYNPYKSEWESVIYDSGDGDATTSVSSNTIYIEPKSVEKKARALEPLQPPKWDEPADYRLWTPPREKQRDNRQKIWACRPRHGLSGR